MALKAGRVGVAPSEVDAYGKLKGGGGQTIEIVNGLNETVPGKALDACQGKVLKDVSDYKIKASSGGVLGLNMRFVSINCTFSEGTAEVIMDNYMDGYSNISSMAFAVVRQSTVVSITGCRIDVALKKLYLQAARETGAYSGTVNVNVMYFVY